MDEDTGSLSAFLRMIFDQIESTFTLRGKLSDLRWSLLGRVLVSLNSVAADAEEKHLWKPMVRRWFDELKNVMYDAVDIMDEIATKILQSKLKADFETSSIKVRNYIPSRFAHKMERKLERLIEKLEDLSRRKDCLGLREGIGIEQPLELLSSVFVGDESSIVGRSGDKEEIIKNLLSDDASSNEMGVIAIVGIGGVGKTTLAQLIYIDDRVNEHFDLLAWVCVSDEFDVSRVTKVVLKHLTRSEPTPLIEDLNLLQVKLYEKLRGKKFLLVLDDVWNRDHGAWEVLSSPFRSGTQECKIIVTTRDVGVASIMQARTIYHLKKLSDEDCWSLFAKLVFSHSNADPSPHLETLGRKIMAKCQGLPMAVKAYGSLLRTNLNVHDWESILEEDLGNLTLREPAFLPLLGLTLSYIYLPSNLKLCFSYCSLFPKDYVFEKHELVLLWMAEGFIKKSKGQELEQVGYDYFLDLTSRSLFQPLSSDNSLFLIDGLVNDLVKSISGPFNVKLEDGCSLEIAQMARHFSYICTRFDEFEKFGALYKAKQLHTFLAINMLPRHNKIAKEVLDDLLPTLSCLRVLSLSHYDNVTLLPKSIGKLKHLRYLNLSFTAIKSLPASICKLCNLQTLKLLGCQYLTTLPTDMWKLINLRYFDITGSGIKKMPIHLDRLKSLQALPSFTVCKNSGSGISELRKLTNLRGKLSISELQEFPMDYQEDTILGNINFLEELVLEWNALDAIIPESEKTVLERLQPCGNLERLTIKCYGGELFPDWISLPSFSNISVLHLYKCKHCCQLPPLGQLPSLLHLSIVEFDKIVSVGHEFCGSISSSTKPFGALKVLKLKQMLNLEEWSFTENDGGAFPHLEELCIDNCPKLGLKESRICGSSSHIYPSWSGLFSTLKTLDITFAEKFDLPLCLDYPSLKRLLLTHCCDSLRSIKLELFPKLCEIRICGLRNLESLSVPKHYKHELETLEIDIHDCPYFVSFPKGGLHAPSLTSLCILNCGSLRSLPEEMHKLLPSLEKLCIEDCPEVELVPEEGLPSSLYSISINGFDKPIVGQSGTSFSKLPSVRYLVTSGHLEDTESHQ